MARPGKAWRDADKGNAWYAKIAGKKTRLGDASLTYEEAEKARVRLAAKATVWEDGNWTLAGTLADCFLDWFQEKHPKSYQTYKRFLQDFVKHCDNPRICLLTAEHVDAWLKDRPSWGSSTQSLGVSVILSMLNWAADPRRRILPRNPLKGLRKPRMKSRGTAWLIDPADHHMVLTNSSQELADLLTGLWLTGTRCCNLCRARIEDIEAGLSAIVVRDHKTVAKTERPLYIPITPALRPLIDRLCRGRAEGLIFRRRDGEAWTTTYVNNLLNKLRTRLRKKGITLRGKISPVCYRHTVATRLINAGASDQDIVALMGWEDTSMLYHHYGHLRSEIKQLGEKWGAVIAQGAAFPAAAGPSCPDGL